MPRTEPPTPAGRARYRRRRPGTVAVAVTVIGAAAVAVVAASGCRQGRRDPIATTPTPPDAGADARAPATPEPVAVGVRDPEALVSVAGLVRPRIDGPVRVTPGVPLVLPAEVATRDDAGRLANLPPPPHRLDGVSARDGRVHPFEVRWYDFVTDDRAGAGAARWLPGGTTGVRVTEWTRAPRRAEMPERLQPVLVGRLDETTRDGDVLRFGATEVEVLPPAPGAAGWPLAEGGYRDAVVAAPAFGPEARHLRPDPDAPDEAPRRWLLAVHADRPGLAAGGLEFDERGGFASVLARTMAAGFAEGLARLDLRSPGTADALRAAWTRTLRDGTTEFAAWPSDTWLEMSRIHDLVTTPWPAARGLEAPHDFLARRDIVGGPFGPPADPDVHEAAFATAQDDHVVDLRAAEDAADEGGVDRRGGFAVVGGVVPGGLVGGLGGESGADDAAAGGGLRLVGVPCREPERVDPHPAAVEERPRHLHGRAGIEAPSARGRDAVLEGDGERRVGIDRGTAIPRAVAELDVLGLEPPALLGALGDAELDVAAEDGPARRPLEAHRASGEHDAPAPDAASRLEAKDAPGGDADLVARSVGQRQRGE